MSLPKLENQAARRLFLDRHLLVRPGAGNGRGADLETVLSRLGFVQVDSVNTLARAHDLILWSRRGQFRPPALGHLVARDRAAFEHWTHDASVIPIGFFPMWRRKFRREAEKMRKSWGAARRDGWSAELDTVLRHITDHGATCSQDVGKDEPKASGGWWDWHPSKTALEFLWRSGELAVCHRKGFRKFYDLTERVIPAPIFVTRPDDVDVIDWAMSEALKRLGFGTSGELSAFFEVATRAEAKAWCATALAMGRIIEIDVEGADGTLRRSFALPDVLDCAAMVPEPTHRVRLLSPFDPALRDRARAERLFGFRYRIEIFVPEAKRQYGYYVFPVLQGDRVIGRIDANRDGAVLVVRAFWPEPGVRMGKGREQAMIAELERAKAISGTSELRFAKDWIRLPA